MPSECAGLKLLSLFIGVWFFQLADKNIKNKLGEPKFKGIAFVEFNDRESVTTVRVYSHLQRLAAQLFAKNKMGTT